MDNTRHFSFRRLNRSFQFHQICSGPMFPMFRMSIHNDFWTSHDFSAPDAVIFSLCRVPRFTLTRYDRSMFEMSCTHVYIKPPHIRTTFDNDIKCFQAPRKLLFIDSVVSNLQNAFLSRKQKGKSIIIAILISRCCFTLKI